MKRDRYVYTDRNTKRDNSFSCRKCGAPVSAWAPGTSRRNHCPYCLHSLHVDITPGDDDERALRSIAEK